MSKCNARNRTCEDVDPATGTPSGWDRVALKRLLSFGNGRDHKHIEVDEPGYPVYGSGGVFAYANDYLFDGESILFGRKGTVDKPLYINDRFWTVDTMYYTEIAPTIQPRFAYYAALTIPFEKYSTNTALPSITQETLGKHELLRPPLSEQRKIVKFLDYETAKIDALIEKQEQLIALLGEKRQAIISHVVTKGLNPDAPMRDSGVEWLGEVPEHWDVCRLKHAVSFLTSGPRGWSDLISDDGTSVFLQSGDLNDELGLRLRTAKLITPPRNAEGVRTKMHSGDIVCCVTGANTGRIAVATNLDHSVFVNQHLALIRPIRDLADPIFLATFLAATPTKTYFSAKQYGLKEGLSLTNVAETPVCLPPVPEQKKIASYLNEIAIKMRRLRELADAQVEVLQERRTALISAAVTGKIDVRGWKRPPSEVEHESELEVA